MRESINPKEKALELFLKFKLFQSDHKNKGVMYALICVDEIIEAIKNSLDCNSEYWEQVKTEIEKI